jgi:hypothetical protein
MDRDDGDANDGMCTCTAQLQAFHRRAVIAVT